MEYALQIGITPSKDKGRYHVSATAVGMTDGNATNAGHIYSGEMHAEVPGEYTVGALWLANIVSHLASNLLDEVFRTERLASAVLLVDLPPIDKSLRVAAGLLLAGRP